MLLYYQNLLQMEESQIVEALPISEHIPETLNQLGSPVVEHQSSLVEMNIQETVPAEHQPEASPTPAQKEVALPLPEDNKESSELTKRSDESEFVNWQISTIRSGKFFFEEKKQPEKDQPAKIDNHLKIKVHPAPPQKQQENPREGKQQKNTLNQSPQLKEQQTFKIKVPKTLSNTKKQLIKYFTEQFGAALRRSKAVKMLFAHFCKENNLTSIKSTLFEDKPKAIEEMNLNKWMVFCKEFDILEKLCTNLNNDNRKETEPQHNSETCTTKQQRRVKQLKKAEATLINIFKSINENRSKINFDGFVSGLLLIFDQLSYSYDEGGAKGFVGQILHCSSQQQCLKKLSGLKFTASTPKIEYQKRCINPADMNALEKSRFSRHNQKQNIASQTRKDGKVSTSPLKRRQKLNVNQVISQAKLTLIRNEAAKYSKQHQKTKTKLVLQEIKQKKNDKSDSQKQLYQYFQTTKDPILDSYFVLEERKLQATRNMNS